MNLDGCRFRPTLYLVYLGTILNHEPKATAKFSRAHETTECREEFA